MKINDKNVSNNLHRFNEIYLEGKEENPVPKNTPVIVYCSDGGGTQGWLSVMEVSDLGLNQLIMRKWITQDEFKSW